ncbi:hypothetical protein FLAVO9AF_130208 [Flavobacterium sp. 9AF]|nr:hypothetical protein FLAVO9AF_130208 [Flavobacterium sp. 9AF]
MINITKINACQKNNPNEKSLINLSIVENYIYSFNFFLKTRPATNRCRSL